VIESVQINTGKVSSSSSENGVESVGAEQVGSVSPAGVLEGIEVGEVCTNDTSVDSLGTGEGHPRPTM
jgi:hypothetical protein